MARTLGSPVPDCDARRTSARGRRKVIDLVIDSRSPGLTAANGEETAYGFGYQASYHKGLPHDVLGRVDAASYHDMVRALTTNDAGAMETLQVGDNRSTAATPRLTTSPKDPLGYRKLTSPLTGHVFDTQGMDAGALAIGAAPRLDGPEMAAEMAELYAMALLRDTSFTDINAGNGAVVTALTTALGTMPFLQPGYVTQDDAERRRYASRAPITSAAALFRGSTPGSKHGHWLSQYMLVGNSNDNATFDPLVANSGGPGFRGISARTGDEDGFVFFGTQIIDQRSVVAKENVDYLTHWAAWLDAQDGVDFNDFNIFRDKRRYLFTPRDIATYVHFDALYQAYLVACLIMAADGKNFPKDRGMPETNSRTRSAFASFGGPHILALVTEVSSRALKHVWRQKWLHHRRARPEVVAAWITLYANDPTHIADLKLREAVKRLHDAIPAAILQRVSAHNTAMSAASPIQPVAPLPGGFPNINAKNYLLPMAFPEGSPTHPAYGAGHATVAGACVTVLKAFFEMFNADGRTPRDWPLPVYDVDFRPGARPAGNENEGGELRVIAAAPAPGTAATHGYTVQGELDKLAMNIANARNMAGVHYYTDYHESLRLGERVAVSIIEEHLSLYSEPVSMSFTSFDGEHVRIATNGEAARLSVQGTTAAEWYGRYAG